MASLDDFLKDSPHLAEPGRRSGDFVTLDVVITGVTDSTTDFIHLGSHFCALKADVIDVSEGQRPVATAQGKSAVLTLKSTARLEWKQSIVASDLSASMPLGFALPTANPPTFRERPAVAAWSARTGYAPAPGATAHIISTGTTCECYCDGVSDDTKQDDY